MKQFEQKNITAEQLLDIVLNSSDPGSQQLLPGDLLVSVKGMRAALENMTPEQKLSSAKVDNGKLLKLAGFGGQFSCNGQLGLALCVL